MGIVGASAAPHVYKSGDRHAGRTERSHTGGRALARSNLVCVALADGAILFGLVLALAALLVVFAGELAAEVSHILNMTPEGAILMGLSLIDLSLAICSGS